MSKKFLKEQAEELLGSELRKVIGVSSETTVICNSCEMGCMNGCTSGCSKKSMPQ